MLKGANLKGGGTPAPPIDQPPLLVRQFQFSACVYPECLLLVIKADQKHNYDVMVSIYKTFI